MSSHLKGWPGWLTMAIAAAVLLVVGATASSGPQTQAERVDELSKQIACPVCSGESVYDSQNASSRALRNQIAELVRDNELNDAEILALVDARNEGDLLLVPESSGLDAIVWVLPVVGFVVGAVGLWLALRRWSVAESDGPGDDETVGASARRSPQKVVAILVAAAVIATGIGFALASAFGDRGAGQEITGRSPADEVRTTLAEARAALVRGDFARANLLFFEVDRLERERGNDNAEALAYLGWTLALRARSEAAQAGAEADPDLIGAALLALDQAMTIEPTYADPQCFAAIIEYNFRNDAAAALPFVERCEELGPPADVRSLVTSFADEIRTAADG